MKYSVPVLLIIIIVLAALLSFFLGRSGVGSQKSAASVATNTSSPSATSTLVPTDVTNIRKNVSAGGILTFPRYELEIPPDWEESRESQSKDIEKVILKKGDYEISITQGGFGGAMCLFPGDADIDGPSAKYESFRDILTKSGDKLRRSWTGQEKSVKGYGICQMTDYGWQSPTSYGHISFITPAGSNPEVIAEMDEILSSLNSLKGI